MVYTERTERYIEPTDQCSTSAGSSKSHTASFKYSKEQHSSSNSSAYKNSSWETKQPPSEDKWKYNNMVRNDREKFNSLHFC
ncbi:uncharacterized protein LOC118741595 isoform X1 [Rhagoletis pomonella]|uniref:uncharacterized protein LOC118741595 isoform X1 n=1 Tax=Rhagoletis pomonella TaxID=28610 RepID=UPI00177F91A0|nr:uncharacterized protein LOC118741595 isoform X1 [Rhagoletis pomonella]